MRKMKNREFTQNFPKNIPEWYPSETIEKGYKKLGSFRNPSVPAMAKSSGRDNKMYNLNESMNLNSRNDADKFKHLYIESQRKKWRNMGKRTYSVGQ